MKIFLTYASEQKGIAEAIAFSLRSRNFQVFLDKDDLPPGRSYDEQIETAIEDSDYLLFLISPESVKPGRYTLTELELARRKWRTPDGSVLPVMVAPTPMDAVPQFLRAVTILEPQGNVAAEVAAHVKQTDRIAGRNLIAYFTGAGLVSGLLSYALIATELPGALALSAIGGTFDLYPGLAFGLALCGLFYAYLRVPLATLVIVLLMVQLSWQLAVFAAVRFGSDIEYGRQSAAINHALGATTSDTVVNSQFDVTNFFSRIGRRIGRRLRDVGRRCDGYKQGALARGRGIDDLRRRNLRSSPDA